MTATLWSAPTSHLQRGHEEIKLEETVRSLALIVAFAILQLPPSQPRVQHSSEAFSLTVATAQSTFAVGIDVKVSTTLTNNSDRQITLMDKRRDCDYPVQVQSADGKPTPLTNYGGQLNCSTGAGLGRNILVTLNPGQSTQDEILVSNVRDMTKPGKYLVEVWRTIPKDLGPNPVKSNAITITITK
jgi:hypothetical protein